MILKLQCNKVLKKIKWKTKLNFKDTIFNTISWYEDYKNIGCREITYKQIKSYLKKIA